MAGRVIKKEKLVKPVRWQDVELCDRCGLRAHFVCTPPSDYDKRRILLCSKHKDEHEEALKVQKFTVKQLTDD